jgi:hypothetical protein
MLARRLMSHTFFIMVHQAFVWVAGALPFAPSPLMGEGWGEGEQPESTPLPAPLPQVERELLSAGPQYTPSTHRII